MEDKKYDVENFGDYDVREIVDGINNMTDTLWYVVQELREDIKQLEFQISMKDDEILILKETIEELNEEINDLELENDMMEDELEELRDEM